MHVNILILMLYVVSNQMNILFYENMRNDFAKSFLVLVAFTSSHTRANAQ